VKEKQKSNNAPTSADRLRYRLPEENFMATLTLQNVPENLVKRIQSTADHNRRSMEQELRAMIESRFAGKEQIPARSDGSKDEALRRIRERWKELPETNPKEVEKWLKEGRP
jgi:plasmid stability protein